MDSNQTAPKCAMKVDIQPYLAWLEQTDPELLRLYSDFRLRGIQARIIYGKFAVLSSGRP